MTESLKRIEVNRDTLADFLGVDRRTVDAMVNSGRLSRSSGRLLNLRDSVQTFVTDLRTKATGRGQSKTAEDAALTAARRRKMEAEADLAEQKAAQQRGELVEASQVVAGWQSILVRLRADLLAVPDRLREDTSRDVADRVDRAIRDALETLADD